MSQISKQALIVDNNQSFPNNNSGQISPSDLRAFNANMIDSLVDELGYRSFTSSVTNSINLLNAFTSSQQPTFNALNSFTASQFEINAGYNAATYSLNVSVNTLNSEVDQLQTWSGSVNQIQSAGVTKGYATRFNFSGLMTASITQNVNGNIADISLISDNTKVGTSSFNAYTASTNSSISNLNSFSASTLIRLTNIESTTASLNSSVSNLNTFTQSQIPFNNSITASVGQLLNSSTTFATTGSNTFVGNQTISSSLFISGNINMANGSDLVTHHVRAAGSNGLELQNASSGIIVSMGAGGGTQAAFTGALTANSISASSFTGLGNLTTYSASVDNRLNNTATTGSNVFSGSQTITGSAGFNVFSASIVSSTASLDFNKANFFTLSLPANANTFINVQNARAGETAMLEITTIGVAATASFSTNVYQPSQSVYIPSNTGSIDILTFASFNGNKVYLAAVKGMTNNY